MVLEIALHLRRGVVGGLRLLVRDLVRIAGLEMDAAVILAVQIEEPRIRDDMAGLGITPPLPMTGRSLT